MPSDTTPAQGALTLMMDLVGSTPATQPQLEAWREFTTLIDGAGLLDNLDDNDARHAVGAILADLTFDGPGKLRGRADWIAAEAAGASPLHDPAAVATALRQVADLSDRP